MNAYAAGWLSSVTSARDRCRIGPPAKAGEPVTNGRAKWPKKTITVSLTAEQFAKMKEAVSNYRKLGQQLRQMEKLSRSIIFQSAPHPGRHKRLSQKVLGTM